MRGAEPAASGDPTRDGLLAAAAEVFAEKGYDRAGVQEIARRAGFTTGAIYGRFRGKAQLLLAAMEANFHDELGKLFAEHRYDDRPTDILTTVGSHLVTDEFDSGQALLLEAFVASRRDPEVAGMLRRIVDERTVSLTALVEDAKQTGAIDTALDTCSIVRFCQAVGLGFLLFGALDLGRPGPVPWETLIARLVDAVAVDAVVPGAAVARGDALVPGDASREGDAANPA